MSIEKLKLADELLATLKSKGYSSKVMIENCYGELHECLSTVLTKNDKSPTLNIHSFLVTCWLMQQDQLEVSAQFLAQLQTVYSISEATFVLRKDGVVEREIVLKNFPSHRLPNRNEALTLLQVQANKKISIKKRR